MLQLYQESVDYIASEMDFLGKKHPHLLDSQEARVLHFHEMLPHLEKNTKDAMQAQKALQKKTAPFTVEQRRRMGMAISMHMKNAEQGSPGSVAAGKNTEPHVYGIVHDRADVARSPRQDNRLGYEHGQLPEGRHCAGRARARGREGSDLQKYADLRQEGPGQEERFP